MRELPEWTKAVSFTADFSFVIVGKNTGVSLIHSSVHSVTVSRPAQNQVPEMKAASFILLFTLKCQNVICEKRPVWPAVMGIVHRCPAWIIRIYETKSGVCSLMFFKQKSLHLHISVFVSTHRFSHESLKFHAFSCWALHILLNSR